MHQPKHVSEPRIKPMHVIDALRSRGDADSARIAGLIEVRAKQTPQADQ